MDWMPEASSAPPKARRRYLWRTLVFGLIFLPLYLGSDVVDARGGDRLLVIVMGYAGMAALLVLVYEFLHLIRQLDELQQRIHITALALGFGVVSTVITLLGMNIEVLNADSLPGSLVALLATLALPLGIVAYYLFLHIIKRRYE